MNRTSKDRIICVDFDSTIMDKSSAPPGHKMGYPEEGAVESITRLYKDHKIVILTARPRAEHNIVRTWLKHFQVPFDDITNVKPDAQVFIDNRGLRFNHDWFNIVNLIIPILDEDPSTQIRKVKTMPEPVAPVVPDPTPETPAPVDTPTTPPVDNGSGNTDVETLKAQLQKIEMERNLLRKKVDTTSKQLEDQTKKELEEKEDYRALAERATSQLDELLKEKKESETKQAVETATSDVFKDFDPKVVELAKTTGLAAANDSDEANRNC
jgi:hypothetical protein